MVVERVLTAHLTRNFALSENESESGRKRDATLEGERKEQLATSTRSLFGSNRADRGKRWSGH